MNRQLLTALIMLEAVLRAKAEQAPKADQYRGTGRSTSLALKQAQWAMDAATRGAEYEVSDHHDTAEAHVAQAKKVSDVLRVLNVEHTIQGNVITVKPLEREEEVQLPSWAVGLNSDLLPLAGAQLLTRNSRRMGNAAISCVHEGLDGTTYCVVTDIGNCLSLTKGELDELFEIGDYLMDPEEVRSRAK